MLSGDLFGGGEAPGLIVVQGYIETMVGGHLKDIVAEHSELVDFAGLMCETDDFLRWLIEELAGLFVVDRNMMSVIDVRDLDPTLVGQHIVVGGQAEFVAEFW